MNDGAAEPASTSASATGRREKSATAFRTISEVATELDLPQHVLRFWESKFAQVRPMKRGGGRRYYRPEDVELLRRIRGLLYEDGYTIKGVQKLLRAEGAKGAGKENGGSEAAAQPETAGLSDEDKAELKAVLAELEEIRSLL